MATLSCRTAAAKALHQVIGRGKSLNSALALFADKVAAKDQSLYAQLCYGTLRFYPRYEAILQRLLNKPLKQKDGDIYALLLIGCYQLNGMRTPDHAAISTVVEACKELKKHWAKNFVNGVLREFQRQQSSIGDQLSSAEKDAHPFWLAKKLLTAWPEHYTEIITANNSQPPFCLRVNSLHHSTQEYLQLLEKANLDARVCSFAESGIRLTNAVEVNQLPGFNQGWVSIQDEAAQLAAGLLKLEAGMRVLDACAAPGGKTCHILETATNLDLVALDNDQTRLNRVSENLSRLGLQATLLCGDASDASQWYENNTFDRILLDAPCSGTGVVRRHPDIKLLRRPEDIPQLAKQQLAILQSLWSCLRQGGYLLYATCSILPEENHEIIQQFLSMESSATSVAIDAPWGIASDLGRQILPRENEADGFFYSLLHKP
jgi:16S rRNA (cytosine967-C5)-methyltransferase